MIVCEPDQPYAGLLAAELGQGVRVVASLTAAEGALADLTTGTDVLVLGPGLELDATLEVVRRLHAAHPAVQIVLVRRNPAWGVAARAIYAGVREVIATEDITAIVDVIRRLHTLDSITVRPRGRIVTVFSAKGGCGKTTLATNLASVLYDGGARRVCLVDLDLTFGDVASTLGLVPERSLVDASGRLDAKSVSRLVTPFRAGLDCVLAPARPGDSAKVSPERVGELLSALSTVYDHVVVDTPSQFSATVLAALDVTHHQILLTTPERPALKNLRLTLDMLDLLSYPRETRAIVVNRSDSRVGLTTGELERMVRNPIAGLLPSRRDVPASINRGVPLALTSPEHVVTTAVRRLVDEHLTERPAVPAPASDTAPNNQLWGWW